LARFARAFSAAIGCRHYVSQRRMERAKAMIGVEAKSIIETTFPLSRSRFAGLSSEILPENSLFAGNLALGTGPHP
jgi:hypothetical protein